MNVEGLVEAASAGVTSAVVIGTAMRRYWTHREVRQQAAFRRAVQQIIDDSMTDLARRQVEFERRQGRHLDRQDQAIGIIRSLIETRTWGNHG